MPPRKTTAPVSEPEPEAAPEPVLEAVPEPEPPAPPPPEPPPPEPEINLVSGDTAPATEGLPSVVEQEEIDDPNLPGNVREANRMARIYRERGYS